MDGVFCLAKHPSKLGWLLSGSCDGEVRIWNLATRKCELLLSLTAPSLALRLAE